MTPAPSGRPLRVAVTVEQSWQRVPGGTATSTLALLAHLRDDPGLEVTGVAARHRAPAPAPWQPPVPVRHLPLPRAALYRSWHALGWPAADRGWPEPADVVHATSPAVPPRTSPLVATVHDLAFLDHPEWYTPRGVRFLRRGTELAHRHADEVVVPSEATRRDCVRAGFDPDRLHVVGHGVEVPEVTPRAVAAWRAERGLDRDYVLWCGTREPRKNLAGLLAGYARLAASDAGVDLVLVGPAGWGREQADAGELDPARVHALGFLPVDELHAAYAGAAAFCYPSLREGFGLPVLEAMAHGVPVVTTAGSAMAEFAGGVAELVDASDPGDVADGLARALSGPPRAGALRERAARFTWQRAAEETARVYRRAAGLPDGPGS